jgi:hypothetical protein
MLGHSDDNLSTEGNAISIVTADPHYQRPHSAIKTLILEHFAVKGMHTVRTFDVVRTDTPAPPLTALNVSDHLAEIRLSEIKATNASIKNAALNGFFFGATDNEYTLARALGAHYLFLFVVMNPDNDYGRPFFVPLTLAQVENRTRARRTQYQVNFRTNMTIDESAPGDWVTFPGHGGIEMWPQEQPSSGSDA